MNGREKLAEKIEKKFVSNKKTDTFATPTKTGRQKREETPGKRRKDL